MSHKDADQILTEIHKNKTFHPTPWECKFLEDLSLYVTIGSIKISDKQSKVLQQIYRRSQGGQGGSNSNR